MCTPNMTVIRYTCMYTYFYYARTTSNMCTPNMTVCISLCLHVIRYYHYYLLSVTNFAIVLVREPSLKFKGVYVMDLSLQQGELLAGTAPPSAPKSLALEMVLDTVCVGYVSVLA